MSEQVIVTREGGKPRLLSLAVVAEIWVDREQVRWSVLVSVIGGSSPRVLRGSLTERQALQLWEALCFWVSRRGGPVFDVEAWEAEQAELSKAGRSGRLRSVR